MDMLGVHRPSPSAPVVHVVDDDLQLARSLMNFFEAADIAAMAHPSPDAFLETWSPASSGCLLLDLHLQGTNGLDFQSRLADEGIRLPVILMTGNADVPSSIRGLKAGAVDFLLKPFGGDQLLAAIRAAFERDRARIAAEGERAILRARHASLSPRESQLFDRVARGSMNKLIAEELGVSEITVKVHRGAMMRKMRAQNIVELVHMAGILGLPSIALDTAAVK